MCIYILNIYYIYTTLDVDVATKKRLPASNVIFLNVYSPNNHRIGTYFHGVFPPTIRAFSTDKKVMNTTL